MPMIVSPKGFGTLNANLVKISLKTSDGFPSDLRWSLVTAGVSALPPGG